MPPSTSTSPVIAASGLGKRYGTQWALRDLDLEVPAGTVLGLLGPNGAGKTTAVRILTTLLRPDTGHASVGGYDVVAQPRRVREQIGLAGQAASVDEILTGRANLEMVGRLYHLPRAEVRRRADELLERLALTDAAGRQVRTYSGGMRRRLDLAAALFARPAVCFLDEPTTGLDPHSRNDLWDVLRELVAAGTTILLTTQYLEEADQLCDAVVVVDRGAEIAHGTPQELKRNLGEERISVSVADPARLRDAADALAPLALGPADIDVERRHVSVAVAPDSSLLELVRALDAAGVPATDVSRRTPTLDDVFLTLTGHAAAPVTELEEALA